MKTGEKKIVLVVLGILALCVSVCAQAETMTYVFDPNQSTVLERNWAWGYYEKWYSIEGKFQLTVNFNVGTAWFEWVDANLSEEIYYADGGFQSTQSLDVLFHMSELVSTDVNNTAIDFVFEKNNPQFPSADVHLQVTFIDDLAHLTGRFSDDMYDGDQYDLDALALRKLVLYYVDGVNGNDNNDGLTQETAFATIQKGIDTAEDGDTVLVWPDVYNEGVDFKGKKITVKSADEPAVLTNPVDYAAAFYTGEDASSVLKNFIITNSYEGIFIAASSPTLTNLTVVDNTYGIRAYAGAQPDISSCIFWDNTNGDLFQCEARYSCIEEGGPGEGNIILDPNFAADPNDFHLRSERGRYWPEHNVWVLDDVTSPCVDGGDPAVEPNEPMPNGGRVNMGAYGNTAYASMSEWPIAGDVNHDGVFDMVDFAILAEDWLSALPWATNEPPEVYITEPEDGVEFCWLVESIWIVADAWDVDSSVVKVEFFVDGDKWGEDTDGSDGWEMVTSFDVGTYILTAKATDDEEATTTSPPVTITATECGP